MTQLPHGLIYGEDIAGPTEHHQFYLDCINAGDILHIAGSADYSIYIWTRKGWSKHYPKEWNPYAPVGACQWLVEQGYGMPNGFNWYQYVDHMRTILNQ